MDAIEIIKAKGHCCISEKPLSSSKNINMVQLRFKASWAYPVSGNVLYGPPQMAVAFVHDDCIVNGIVTGHIRFAVEFSNGEIIYHALPPPQVCRVCGCTEHDPCYDESLQNCWWMEPDLCSHCVLKPGEAKRYSLIKKEIKPGSK